MEAEKRSLETILSDHNSWAWTNGRKGVRAVLTGDALQEGGEILTRNAFILDGADLTGIRLDMDKFFGAVLPTSEAKFVGATLIGKLTYTGLDHCDIANADLTQGRQANLHRAKNIHKAHFIERDFNGTASELLHRVSAALDKHYVSKPQRALVYASYLARHAKKKVLALVS